LNKKALIVDKSPITRRLLSNILKKVNLETDTAKKEEEIKKLTGYELVILGKDFYDLVEKILNKYPTRILVIQDNEETTEAIEKGALDFIPKPGKPGVSPTQIENKIKDVLKIPKFKVLLNKKGKKITINKTDFKPNKDTRFVLIGASTGGPRLIETIVSTLPENYPYPICIVQHMPVNFTKKFAERLNSISKLQVLEAKNNEEVTPGKIIIGKGGFHLHLSRRILDKSVICKLVPNTSGRFFVPSVDELFFSALKAVNPKKIMAVLLTGIGDDGAEGMVALKKAGAYTIAESEETAVVYGMPKEAYERGGTTKVLPFPDIVKEIIKYGSEENKLDFE
jgi:two-component system chemotaxis response regulator CheB